MKKNYWAIIGVVAVAVVVLTSTAFARSDSSRSAAPLVQAVRQATAQFNNVEKAKSAEYGVFHGCVSGPQDGAMGIHFTNGKFVTDGVIDVNHPEALLYEPNDGKLRLLGVEYIVDAAGWNANHKAPPVLMGQLFNFVGAPNRYGIPAFYELHVWAWKINPAGVFADWNPNVSCQEYIPDTGMPDGHH